MAGEVEISAFLMTELIGRVLEEGTEYERKEVKRWLEGKELRKKIEVADAKGKESLLGKLRELDAL